MLFFLTPPRNPDTFKSVPLLPGKKKTLAPPPGCTLTLHSCIGYRYLQQVGLKPKRFEKPLILLTLHTHLSSSPPVFVSAIQFHIIAVHTDFPLLNKQTRTHTNLVCSDESCTPSLLPGWSLQMSFFEICGIRCFDLLNQR